MIHIPLPLDIGYILHTIYIYSRIEKKTEANSFNRHQQDKNIENRIYILQSSFLTHDTLVYR